MSAIPRLGLTLALGLALALGAPVASRAESTPFPEPPALTPAVKERVLGLNAAELFNLDPHATRCALASDPIADARMTAAHLRDEGALYADALVHAGVPVKYHPGEGLIHGYFGLVDASDAARAEAQRARADFKAMLAKGA